MKSDSGFTLLEILVALTIVGMVTGAMFSQLGGSKKLAFKARNVVDQTTMTRLLVNAVSLDLVSDVRDTLPADFSFEIVSERIAHPKRKTKPMLYGLQLEKIVLKGDVLSVYRWKQYDLPR